MRRDSSTPKQLRQRLLSPTPTVSRDGEGVRGIRDTDIFRSVGKLFGGWKPIGGGGTGTVLLPKKKMTSFHPVEEIVDFLIEESKSKQLNFQEAYVLASLLVDFDLFQDDLTKKVGFIPKPLSHSYLTRPPFKFSTSMIYPRNIMKPRMSKSLLHVRFYSKDSFPKVRDHLIQKKMFELLSTQAPIKRMLKSYPKQIKDSV